MALRIWSIFIAITKNPGVSDEMRQPVRFSLRHTSKTSEKTLHDAALCPNSLRPITRAIGQVPVPCRMLSRVVRSSLRLLRGTIRLARALEGL